MKKARLIVIQILPCSFCSIKTEGETGHPKGITTVGETMVGAGTLTGGETSPLASLENGIGIGMVIMVIMIGTRGQHNQ